MKPEDGSRNSENSRFPRNNEHHTLVTEQTTGQRMKLRSLPGYSRLFVDYAEGAESVRAFLPVRPDLEALLSHAAAARDREVPRDEASTVLAGQASEQGCGERVLENIRLLARPGTVVVMTSLQPSFFGGPLCLLLRCLTTVRLAEELGRNGAPAIPLAWIQRGDGLSGPERPVFLLDADSKLVTLSPGGPARDQDEEPLQRILRTAPAGWDTEPVRDLDRLRLPGMSAQAISARFLGRITDDLGLVFVDPGSPSFRSFAAASDAASTRDYAKTSALLSDRSAAVSRAGYPPNASGSEMDRDFIETHLTLSRILPVAAVVAGSHDIRDSCLAVPAGAGPGAAPLLWPRLSATLLDDRTKKVLDRYNLNVETLFAGEQEVLQRAGLDEMEREGAACFAGIRAAIETGTREAAALAPEEALRREVEESRGKILYQVGKLQERFASASARRREAAQRHLERARNTLAPESRPQECALAVLHFLLRYSRTVVSRIYGQTAIWNHDHQILKVE